MGYCYQYEERQDGTVCLLRMFGDSPEVVVPETINGMEISEIGAYCFSKSNRVGECLTFGEEKNLRELCGSYLERLVLPEGVRILGDFACYQCSSLKEIVVGNALTQIGSDAFMNCRRLEKVTIVGSVTEPSGLRQILGQRKQKTEVTFCKAGETEAVLLYPEYSETYDEIGPAHIFTLNIEGDGFRVRQCFQNEIVDVGQYDEVFVQASQREQEDTLCRMALLRLYYPVKLSGEKKEIYEKYLCQHIGAFAKHLVEEKNMVFLSFLIQNNYLRETEMATCIRYAVSMQWAEGIRQLLQYQHDITKNKIEDSYEFEEFD